MSLLLLSWHGVLLPVVMKVGPVPLVHVLLRVGIVGVLLVCVLLLLLLHGVLVLGRLPVVPAVALRCQPHGVAVRVFHVPQGVLKK
jgi:hypothetical protein